MKCDENGGCPVCCEFSDNCIPYKAPDDCHLTPDLFPIIRAMIAGEWTCEKCRIWYSGTNKRGEHYADCEIHYRDPRPCVDWKPRED